MDAKTHIDGREMTSKEFREYIKRYKSLFEHQTSVLESFENDGSLLSVSFNVLYAALLEDRLRYCRVGSQYYRAMAEKSWWLVKTIAIYRATRYESFHYETLGRLIQVRMMIKLSRNGTEEKAK